jgi:hypothetical protein
MSVEKVLFSIPKEIIEDNRHRALLPDAVRVKLIERAEVGSGKAIEIDIQDLLTLDDKISEEQARRGFDKDYNLNEYGRYLESLLAAIEKIRLQFF